MCLGPMTHVRLSWALNSAEEMLCFQSYGFFFSFKTELPASIGKIALLGECGQNNNNKCDHINTTSLKNSMMLSGQ